MKILTVIENKKNNNVYFTFIDEYTQEKIGCFNTIKQAIDYAYIEVYEGNLDINYNDISGLYPAYDIITHGI